MARPVKCRKIGCSPVNRFFKPVGVPLCDLEEVVLAVDELEAMRLTSLEGCYQQEAAVRMGVSRQTIGNILASAHAKVADALVNGKALRLGDEGADSVSHCP